MRDLCKRILAGVSVGALIMTLLAPATSYASLDSAFDNLSSYSGGSFRTSSRIGYSLPGASMRFENKTYSLVQAEPPSIEIGCNGIDFHLGGFSFIDGRQIEEMLENITNSTAMLFLLALKNLCGICGNVLEWAEQVAQMASQLSVNSCEVAQGIVDKATEVGQNAACSVIGTEVNNQASDWIASKQRACANLERASDEVREGLADGTEGDREKNVEISGNVTWKALQKFGVAPLEQSDNQRSQAVAELFMSWMGTTVAYQGETSYPPKIKDAETFLGIFMCGSQKPNASALSQPVRESIGVFCKDIWGEGESSAAGVKLYRCLDDMNESDPVKECSTIGEREIKDLDLGHGFLTKVAIELDGAVQRAINNQAPTTTQMRLIASAPFPLYQAINIASTHPEIGRDLVMSHSVILAHQIGIEYIRHVLREAAKQTGGSSLPAKIARAQSDQQQRLTLASEKVIENINVYSLAHDRIMESVRRIQHMLVQATRSSGLVGTDFAADLVRMEGN